jgi:hypothetical protein
MQENLQSTLHPDMSIFVQNWRIIPGAGGPLQDYFAAVGE